MLAYALAYTYLVISFASGDPEVFIPAHNAKHCEEMRAGAAFRGNVKGTSCATSRIELKAYHIPPKDE
jgi:hypothetical protein